MPTPPTKPILSLEARNGNKPTIREEKEKAKPKPY